METNYDVRHEPDFNQNNFEYFLHNFWGFFQEILPEANINLFFGREIFFRTFLRMEQLYFGINRLLKNPHFSNWVKKDLAA